MLVPINKILLISLVPYLGFCQYAAPSFFASERSSNPAIIPFRKSGQHSINASRNDVTKEQTQTNNGTSIDWKTKIDVTDLKYFYGGKGDGLTSESFYTMANGTRVKRAEYGSDSMENTSKSTSAFYGLSLGYNLGKSFSLGAGVAVSYFRQSYTDQFKFTGFDSKSIYTTDNKYIAPMVGVMFNLVGPFYIGSFYQKLTNTAKNSLQYFNNGTLDSNASFSGKESKFEQKVMAFGVGIKTDRFHLEAGQEIMPLEVTTYNESSGEATTNKVNATKTSVIAETFIGNWSFGYHGTQYYSQFMEVEDITRTILIYSNSGEEKRLSHKFNFSFGKDKGSSFSGSFSTSKITTDEPAQQGSKTKYPTKTKDTSYGLSYTYSF